MSTRPGEPQSHTTMTTFNAETAAAAARYRIAATTLTVRRNVLAREQARNPPQDLSLQIATRLVQDAEQDLHTIAAQAHYLGIDNLADPAKADTGSVPT